MSEVFSKLTMSELLFRHALFAAAVGSAPTKERAFISTACLESVRDEIDRRLAEAIETGGSEVRYALEGAS